MATAEAPSARARLRGVAATPVSVTARTVGGRRVAKQFLGLADRSDDEMEWAVGETARGSVRLFRAVAPQDTGRLERGILASISGKSARITARARDPETGFDYVAVSRWGHRVGRIYPKPPNRALRLTIGGQVLYRTSVKGYRPGSDWAARPLSQIRVLAGAIVSEAGRRIARAL
jgi:hypothetical protein